LHLEYLKTLTLLIRHKHIVSPGGHSNRVRKISHSDSVLSDDPERGAIEVICQYSMREGVGNK